MIADIMRTSWSWSEVAIYKPTSIVTGLLPRRDRSSKTDMWFRGLKTWHEIGDICETEGFGAVATNSNMPRVTDLTQKTGLASAWWSILCIYCFSPMSTLAELAH